MTREDWKKYGRYHNAATRCPVCGQPIVKNDEGVTYVKTQRKTHIFVHEKCAGLKGGSND